MVSCSGMMVTPGSPPSSFALAFACRTFASTLWIRPFDWANISRAVADIICVLLS